jgi:drug/metabolite transporter (DMT)-like permease
MLLAMIGVGVVALSDACHWQNGLICPAIRDFIQGRAVVGNLLALAGALAVTGYLLIGRKLRTRISLVPYIFVVYGMAAILLVLLMFAAGQSPFGYQPATYGWMVLLALVPQLIGHSTFNWALSFLPAAFVALATLGEPIGTILLAYFFLQEVPSWMKLAGGILILAGIYIASKTKSN